MRTFRTLATVGVVSAAGMLGLAGTAAADGGCEPTHTGELGDGTPVYFGCETPIDDGMDQPPLYPQSATVAFAR